MGKRSAAPCAIDSVSTVSSTWIAPTRQTSWQHKHRTQSAGVCSTPVSSPSTYFSNAPVGQNVTQIRHPVQRSGSMATCPHSRVAICACDGTPIANKASASSSRRSGIKCGNVPSGRTFMRWKKSEPRVSIAAGQADACSHQYGSGTHVALPSSRQTLSGNSSVMSIRTALPQAPSRTFALSHTLTAIMRPASSISS